jgi:hypothetical protein
MVHAFDGSVDELGKVESFFISVGRIPRIRHRLKAVLTRYRTHTHTIFILILYSYSDCTHTQTVLILYSYCTHAVLILILYSYCTHAH